MKLFMRANSWSTNAIADEVSFIKDCFALRTFFYIPRSKSYLRILLTSIFPSIFRVTGCSNNPNLSSRKNKMLSSLLYWFSSYKYAKLVH